MKRTIKLITVISILLLFIAACDTIEKENGKENETRTKIENNEGQNKSTVREKPIKRIDNKKTINNSIKVEDFVPFNKDTLYIYEGIGNEYAEQKAYIEFIEDNKVQVKMINPGTNTIRILEYKDGELREDYTESEFYHIENKLNVEGNSGSILLKEPLQLGNSWETLDGNIRSITGLNVKLDLPYEKLNTIEVTTELGNGIVQLDYYSVGLGHVASIYKDGEYEVKTLLEKIIKGPLEENIRFYYPLEDGTGSVYKDKKIKFSTNDKIENILAEGFKNPENKTLINILSDDATINSLKLDKTNNIVRVDLNQNFLKENEKFGSTLEYDIIQNLVNTLGKYYEVDKVSITIDGKEYSSGHLLLEPDDYFITTDDAVKIVD